MSTRTLFFAVVAVVCVVLVPVVGRFPGIPIGLAVTYVVLAGLSWLDDRARHRRAPGQGPSNR